MLGEGLVKEKILDMEFWKKPLDEEFYYCLSDNYELLSLKYITVYL